MPTREQLIVAEARSWVRTPFRHQGRVKGKGVDCIGLVKAAMVASRTMDAGVAADIEHDFRGYSRLPDGKSLPTVLARVADRVAWPARRPGDIILFFWEANKPQHVAVLTAVEPAYMVHAYALARRCGEQRINSEWWPRLYGLYRMREAC